MWSRHLLLVQQSCFYHSNQGRTIDDWYVDRVSITHSTSPRQHIWTFAAALDEVPAHNLHACPCMHVPIPNHMWHTLASFSEP